MTSCSGATEISRKKTLWTLHAHLHPPPNLIFKGKFIRPIYISAQIQQKVSSGLPEDSQGLASATPPPYRVNGP